MQNTTFAPQPPTNPSVPSLPQRFVSNETIVFLPCPPSNTSFPRKRPFSRLAHWSCMNVQGMSFCIWPGNEESMIRKKFLNKVIKGCLLLETVTLNVGARASGPFQCHYETARLGDVSSVQECHRCQPQVFRVFFHRTIHSRKRWFGYGFPSINRKTFLLLVLSSLFSNFFQLSYFVTT
jgi:hypothetical protein